MGSSGIFAVILSILSLILLLLFRVSDKKKYSYEQAKKLKDQLVSDIRNSDNVFKQDIAEISATLSSQEKQVKSYISLLKTEIDNMLSYKEDFKLCNIAINNCKNAIQGLILLSEETSEKSKRIEETQIKLQNMENNLSDFSSGVAEKIRNSANEIISDAQQALNSIKGEYNMYFQKLNAVREEQIKHENSGFNLDWNQNDNEQ